MHIITLGATGMLARVTTTLAIRSTRVDVLARHPSVLDGPNLHPVAVDWRRSETLEPYLRTIQASAPVDLALLWLHGDAGDTGQRLCQCARPKHVVHVLSSAAADPARPQPERRRAYERWCDRYTEVILGFERDARGSRWLTDDEIVRGTLQAIDGDAPRLIVGTVEPWSARP